AADGALKRHHRLQLRRVAGAAVDGGKVVQHPREDLALADGAHVLGREPRRKADRARQVLLQGRAVEGGAAAERVEDALAAGLARADEEAPREADAGEVEAEPPADLEEHDRQRDGDAEAPGQDLVEAAVLRVVVILLVAAKPDLDEELLDRRVEEALAGARRG